SVLSPDTAISLLSALSLHDAFRSLLYFAHHVFSAVFVLYAGYRYGWGAWEVGLLLALVGALDMIVQGVLTGPVVKRLGDRRTMRSEEHTSELQSRENLVCRLLLEK